MKIITSKSIFAFFIIILVFSFIINNFFTENNFSKKELTKKKPSNKEEKILGIKIRQQNKKGDKFLIVAETLQEFSSKEKKVILENSITTIDQNGIFTTIIAGHAIISNNYDNFNFSDKVEITKKLRKFTLKTETLIGNFKKGDFYTNDEVDIVSGNTIINGKGLNVKKNGEYIKIKGKAKLIMLLLKKNDD